MKERKKKKMKKKIIFAFKRSKFRTKIMIYILILQYLLVRLIVFLRMRSYAERRKKVNCCDNYVLLKPRL